MSADRQSTADDGELDRRLRLTFRTIMPLLDANSPSESADGTDRTPACDRSVRSSSPGSDHASPSSPSRRQQSPSLASLRCSRSTTKAIVTCRRRRGHARRHPHRTPVSSMHVFGSEARGRRLRRRQRQELTSTNTGSVDRLADLARWGNRSSSTATMEPRRSTWSDRTGRTNTK